VNENSEDHRALRRHHATLRVCTVLLAADDSLCSSGTPELVPIFRD